MKDAGLDWSCYYHIRDYYVDRDRFAQFFSAKGAAFMARSWNRMPQFDGLFDRQNTPRPRTGFSNCSPD
jgi:xylan 1,4-beta-xylosidase